MYRTNKIGPFQVVDPSTSRQTFGSINTTDESNYNDALKPILLNTSVAKRVYETKRFNTYSMTAFKNIAIGCKLAPISSDKDVFVSMSGVCRLITSEGGYDERTQIIPVLGYFSTTTDVTNWCMLNNSERSDKNVCSVNTQVLLSDVNAGGVDTTKSLFLGYMVSSGTYAPTLNSVELSMSAMYNLADLTTQSGLY
jgi:hypothetical protein